MDKWSYINYGIKIVVILWALFLVISPLFMLGSFGSLLNSSFFANLISFSLIGIALALGFLIWLYWNWSEIPVLFCLALVTLLRHMKTIEMGGIPVDTGRLAGSIFILFLVGGILAWQNS